MVTGLRSDNDSCVKGFHTERLVNLKSGTRLRRWHNEVPTAESCGTRHLAATHLRGGGGGLEVFTGTDSNGGGHTVLLFCGDTEGLIRSQDAQRERSRFMHTSLDEDETRLRASGGI